MEAGEEFVPRTGVRHGHVQEFDFAAKAQAPDVFVPSSSSPPPRRRAVGRKPGVRPAPKSPCRFSRPALPSVEDPVASALAMAEVVRKEDRKLELNGREHGGKILCLRTSCGGSKTIAACEYEKHSDYILMEMAGQSVMCLKKCPTAAVDTVETTIRNAISPLPSINNICLRCKPSFHAYTFSEIHGYMWSLQRAEPI